MCGGGFDFDSASLLAEIEVAAVVVAVVGTKELAVVVAAVAEAYTFACTSFRPLGYNDLSMDCVVIRVDRQRVKDLPPVWARR